MLLLGDETAERGYQQIIDTYAKPSSGNRLPTRQRKRCRSCPTTAR